MAAATMRKRRPESGQSTIELALAIIVLLFLIAGIVDLGRAFFTYIAMRDAASEGANYGSSYPNDTTGIINHVRGSSQKPVDLTQTTTDVTYTGANHCLGTGIKVTVKYDNFPFIMPIWGFGLLPKTINLSASITNEILVQCP